MSTSDFFFPLTTIHYNISTIIERPATGAFFAFHIHLESSSLILIIIPGNALSLHIGEHKLSFRIKKLNITRYSLTETTNM